MSELLEAAFEDKLHALARKFNKAGLRLEFIADSFEARGWFAKKYLVGRDVEIPNDIGLDGETTSVRPCGITINLRAVGHLASGQRDFDPRTWKS